MKQWRFKEQMMLFGLITFLSAGSVAAENKGMTWGVNRYNSDLDISRVHCYGQVGPNRGPCNPYQGDTSCSVALPVLCLKIDGSPRPPYELPHCPSCAMNDEYYNGWAEGTVRLTEPVPGNTFANLSDVNAYCEAQLGSGYRAAEFHDGRWVRGMDQDHFYDSTWPLTTSSGGWGFYAPGQIPDSRFWVHINDQDANCWDRSTVLNTDPFADAGENQSAVQGEEVCFDGSGSFDADNDELSYSWTLTEWPTGSSAVIDNPAVDKPCILADFPGTYRVSLTVNDGTVDSVPSTADCAVTAGYSLAVDVIGRIVIRNYKEDKDFARFKITGMTDIGIVAKDAADSGTPLTFRFGSDDKPAIYSFTADEFDAAGNRLTYRGSEGDNIVRCRFRRERCVVKIRYTDLDGDALDALLTGEMTVSLAIGETTYSNTGTWTQFGSGSGRWTKYRKNKAEPKPEPVPTVTSLTGRVWMDRNLGASRVAASLTDEDAYGGLYQWGRLTDGHEKRTSLTTTILSSTDVPGHDNFILAPNYDWRISHNDNLWQGVNGINNPCPNGFRLPTTSEFEVERASWSSDTPEGAFASPLKLPFAGWRVWYKDVIARSGTQGAYWTSTGSGTYGMIFHFYDGYMATHSGYRASGISVRCIQALPEE